MTEPTQTFPSREVAKLNKYYSRRHRTNEGQMKARDRWHTEKSHEAKQAAAKALFDERQKRSPQEQLALLDSRLGKGVGAAKERKRLQAQLTKAPTPEVKAEAPTTPKKPQGRQAHKGKRS